MAYTFDGPNKLIILSNGTTTVDVKDMYSRWKEWVATSDNSKYLIAFSALGGDPLPGARYLGTTYFVENGWKIRPYEGNHTLVVSGNMYARDGSDPFVNTVGTFNVRIMLSVSNLVDTVNLSGGGGSSAADIWSHPGRTLSAAGNDAVADAVRVELTPELDHVLTLQNGQGLNSTQATMLLEIYRLYGLDPAKPLVVTQSNRSAGAEIMQSITGNESVTTITRT